MVERKGEQKRLKNQYKHYDMVLKERMAREIGAFLVTLFNKGYMSKSAVKADFGIDYKTTALLCSGAPSCTFGTMRKFAYVIAYYIHLAEVKAEGIKYKVDRDAEIANVHHERNSFIALYGIQASCVLDMADKNKDLRQVVRQDLTIS